MENSRLHSQEPSFRPEPLNQEPRWAIVSYRISLVSGPGGVINSNAHTAILLIAAPAATPDLGGGRERRSLLHDGNSFPGPGRKVHATLPDLWVGQLKVRKPSLQGLTPEVKDRGGRCNTEP